MGRLMGWRELRGWLRAMNRALEAQEPDPGRWTQASEQNFAELHQQRDRLRGRG